VSVRFVALGDSITVGLGDPMPDRTWRGWAAILAHSLGSPAEVEFHNLAELGARAADLRHRQLTAALALRPSVAAVLVGVNDTLRRTFDINHFGQSLRHVVGSLTGAGATVLTARLPDPGRMFGLPGSLARPLARRIRAVNAVTDLVASRFDTVHFDAAEHPETYERSMWSVDRLHPSERGHRLMASAFADLLIERGFPVIQRPSREPTNRPPDRVAQAFWLATKGTTWVLDRSTDLVPYLIGMAVADRWQRARGHAARIDERIGAEIAYALSQMETWSTPEPVDAAERDAVLA
jgi:lysophospholipase L1-like esterase